MISLKMISQGHSFEGRPNFSGRSPIMPAASAILHSSVSAAKANTSKAPIMRIPYDEHLLARITQQAMKRAYSSNQHLRKQSTGTIMLQSHARRTGRIEQIHRY